MPGTLFVVATPIGNLEDFTFRALRTLKDVDVVAAEDTRRTLKLLTHYGIRKPLVSLHEHNERRETPRLVAKLVAGESIALVTDAGTPAIADPGATLVRAAHEHHLPVVAIPGPSAVAAALSVSGFTGDEFSFFGFVPRAGAERTEWFARLAAETRVVVFFETPHRVRRTLNDIGTLLVNRQILIARELTKLNEQLVIRQIKDVADDVVERGEFVIVLSRPVGEELSAQRTEEAVNLLGRLVDMAGVEEGLAVEMTAHALSLPASAVRKARKLRGIAENRRREADS
jgi:16S rRNA (cytidine1402-2'-O)-methyltransferase